MRQDSIDGRPGCLGDADARASDGGRGVAGAPAQPGRVGQLLNIEVPLDLQPHRALRVVPRVCLGDLGVDVRQPLSIFLARGLIEDFARGAKGVGGESLGRCGVGLLGSVGAPPSALSPLTRSSAWISVSGTARSLRDVEQALGVSKREGGPRESNRPELAFAPEDICLDGDRCGVGLCYIRQTVRRLLKPGHAKIVCRRLSRRKVCASAFSVVLKVPGATEQPPGRPAQTLPHGSKSSALGHRERIEEMRSSIVEVVHRGPRSGPDTCSSHWSGRCPTPDKFRDRTGVWQKS